MNKSAFTFRLLLFAVCSISHAQSAKIKISNPSSLERKETVVSIPWSGILAKNPKIDTANFKVINATTQKEVEWQLELKGQTEIQNLLVQTDIPGNGSVNLLIQKGKFTERVTKTYCRYVPERKDDFAWENDKIAHRMYGKALEGTSENAYGLDVWVKRSPKMVLNERYKRGKYHEDAGDGMDYYHVGFSLGAGNCAPIVKDSIYYSQNYRRWKVLDNGPIRSTFQLEYDAWDVNGIKVTATKTFSIDAGSQMTRIEAQYFFDGNPNLPVAIGIIKRKDAGAISLDEKSGIMGYWEPQMGEDGITGVGCILTTPVTKMKITDAQILTVTTIKASEPLVYYTGASWNKAQVFTEQESWFKYLKDFKTRIMNPLQVVVE